MDQVFNQLLQDIAAYLPTALAALGVLLGGWLVAWIIAAFVGAILRRTGIDQRLGGALARKEAASPLRLTNWISRGVFYLIMLFVVVAFLQTLNLTIVAGPINTLLDQILAYLPQLLGAGVLLLVTWLAASALRLVITRALVAVRLDERLSSQAELEAAERVSISSTMGTVAYWLVFLLFLPAILGALNLQGLLEPVQGMVDQILGVLPNILAAAVILLLGWLAARIVRQILSNLLSGTGLDRFSERVGLSGALGGLKLSSVIGTVVYVLILIPVVTAALDALAIPAVTDPASEMLGAIFLALPSVFGAIVLIGIAYAVARVAGTFVTNALTGIGFNRVLSWIGIRAEVEEGSQTPSQLLGYLTTIAIMIFAVIEAAELLGFAILAELAAQFLVVAGRVFVGLVILGLGLYLASLAERVVRNTGGSQARLLAPASRIVIVVFSGSLALRQMGIAEDIVNLAFGIVLGAIAVAAALAFGLGSREIAARELEKLLDRARRPGRQEG
jgi:hypothetical protein